MTQREANRRIRQALRAINQLRDIPVGRMTTDVSKSVFGIYDRGEQLNRASREAGIIKRDIYA